MVKSIVLLVHLLPWSRKKSWPFHWPFWRFHSVLLSLYSVRLVYLDLATHKESRPKDLLIWRRLAGHLLCARDVRLSTLEDALSDP